MNVPPPLSRMSSTLGMAFEAANLRSALDAGTTSDVPGIDQDIEEQIEEEVNRNRAAVQAPQPTQENMSDDGAEADDTKVGQFKEDFPTLNEMSYKLKNMHAELYLMLKRQGMNPYDMLTAMQKEVDDMPETAATKQQDVAAYNTTVSLFGAARDNENLREFLADLFTNLHHYKTDKPKIAVLNEEIKIMNMLYAEKEEETLVTALRAKQKAREASVAAKGKAVGEKRARDAIDKETTKKSKGESAKPQ
eukprot:scaffold118713_cov69-Phaeocystis_antarctica.AAC.1